ncbi:N-ethylmaleimide-sensitive fusion protein [Heterostelium album PN500]|uniref:Vesicle-fusing ATPase n=1 Tax=Heterostelium pallidum (strain ATCC 26659 / Pp 5 / PN500) TaxID=670386 RepID=D3BDZ2_HETP5|nr:N-ethylmaleimide-sensitive fusion protein [Heterostelium album PN500]EFA80123.1 N-ethylmaleimide-sensitive fusion protein [Heterostelium album PN500]|eukprot:XP_020432243.1 N-ethylmaleimide-sensitive fusion protein [Heterostelium album PN500]
MANRSIRLKVESVPNDSAAFSNRVFMNPKDFRQILQPTGNRENTNYVTINENYVLSASESPDVAVGTIGLSKAQRQIWLQFGLKEEISVKAFEPEPTVASSITFKIDYLTAGKKGPRLDAKLIALQISRDYDSQYFMEGQSLFINYSQSNFVLTVSKVQLTPDSGEAHQGLLLTTTQVILVKADGASIDIESNGPLTSIPVFKQEWDFENMGIGGLDAEFRDIFRRAFASRIFPPAIVAKLGVQHVKGILLHGPPGTGKTLIARQISKMLNGREPKIVSGPEVLGRYVGQPEENIRNLFKDAEIEYKQKGEDSQLHIIIFDEIDSICKTRGTKTGDAGVNDSIVNQLLAKIEGVESLNNILVIGMTNRKDMIDEALLRPGRLEVHVEISLPNEEGRVQIFKIHTAKMTANKLMAPDVNLKHLAANTKNYSGAEIEGVVKAATSYAFSRQVDTKNIKNVELKLDQLHVNASDFERALGDIKPAFGVDEELFNNYAINGIINYGPAFEKIQQSGQTFIEQVKNSNRTPLVSILLPGKPGSGKSSLATTLASTSGFPYIRIISPDDLVGFTEIAKASKITKIFEDSYKSPMSCIIVDDIERLIEFVPIGPRFSNTILQTLTVLLKRTPPKGRKLLILATTSNPEAIRDLGLDECFATSMQVPSITKPEEFKKVLLELEAFSPQDVDLATKKCFTGQPITVKQLIMVVEMARQESGDPIENLRMSIEDLQARFF